jgi:hypothetical protein
MGVMHRVGWQIPPQWRKGINRGDAAEMHYRSGILVVMRSIQPEKAFFREMAPDQHELSVMRWA